LRRRDITHDLYYTLCTHSSQCLSSDTSSILVRVTDLQIWDIGTKEVNRLQYGFFC